MVGISKKTPEEREDKIQKDRAYTKEYYSDPANKARQREYYKTYNQDPMNKESHKKSQRRFRMTAKGKACNERYWKKRRLRDENNKEDNDKDPSISVSL